MMLAQALRVEMVRASGTGREALPGASQVEWSVRMVSPGCPQYENTSALGGAISSAYSEGQTVEHP